MTDARAVQAGWNTEFARASTAERRRMLTDEPLIRLPGKGSFDARRAAAWAQILEEEKRT